MGDWSNEKMKWYDPADRKALPAGLAVFLLAGSGFLAAGLGWWSLLTAFALGCAALNITAGRSRVRTRRRKGRHP
jgi:hypothetical protein